MGEATGTEKAPKKSFFKGVKAEFSKIVGKQTVVVLAVTAVLGLIIAVLDFIIKWGLSFIIK